MKTLGVERIVSVSAVGSMREAYEPKHIVVPDQFFDRTRHRPDTFFGDGLVAHVAFADPVCSELVTVFGEAAAAAGATVHVGGTYLCMEGPQFSTRGESLIYRQWGVDVIGMTNLQEAKLAREAEICYATLAMVTGLRLLARGRGRRAGRLGHGGAQSERRHGPSRRAPGRRPDRGRTARGCGCHDALRYALITPRELVPRATLERLAPIVGRYMAVE